MKKKTIRAGIYLVLLLIIVFGAQQFRLADMRDITEMFAGVQAFTIIRLLVMVLFVLLLSELIKLLCSAIKAKTHRGRTVQTLLLSLTRYVAAIVILCWGLSLVGVDVSTILASVGVLALIVGFGAESLITDVITGIFMLFENQYNVGDIIEVSGFRGTVSNIGIRTTSITDSSGNIKIINNSDMRNILNRSNKASKAVCDFSVPYSTDLESLEERLPALLSAIYERNREVLLSAPVYVGVQSLGESALVLRFAADVPEAQIYSGARVLNRELFLAMRKIGVESPYPQLDVHQV